MSSESAERTQPVDADPELREKLQADLGGDFVIERELGRGGMAVVFLARDVHLGRLVAVKLLPPELTFAGSGGLIERFKREARTAATLDHPHIIPIYRVSTGGKLFWYAMKYLEGEALDDLLKREHQLSFERAADIVKQVAEALGYAHRKSVIHRDVKPANVMLDESGWVTVTDFGIAKALDTNSLTGSGSMIGTPYYMSPEQCSGKKVTGASDEYSLGVMAYQMLSGHLPFTGETVIDIVKKHCMDPVPPLSVLRPNTPPALVAVVERALSKSPEERFPTVTEFAAGFARAASDRENGIGERTADVVDARQRPSKTAVVSAAAGAGRRPATGRNRPQARRWAPLLVGPSPAATEKPAPGEIGPARRRWARFVGVGAVVVGGAVGVALWRPWAPAASAGRGSAANAQSLSAPAASPRASAAETKGPAPRSGTPAATARPALLILRRLPRGATTTVDGVRTRGSRITLTPGPHLVRVVAQGFEPWSDSLTTRAGETLTRTVQLRAPPAQVAANRASLPAQQGASKPTPAAASQVARSTPKAPMAAGIAFITVGSRPLATITINGEPVSNPTYDHPVPAGLVLLHFAVRDSTGIWVVDTSVTVTAGEKRNLGRIALARHP